jgi:hypothetical protein
MNASELPGVRLVAASGDRAGLVLAQWGLGTLSTTTLDSPLPHVS